MKTSQKFVCCSRCGDELSADVMLQLNGSICAFCDNIRSEALQIHEHRLRNGEPKTVRNLGIANKSSGNLAVENCTSLP